jgi:hypothetical protein
MNNKEPFVKPEVRVATFDSLLVIYLSLSYPHTYTWEQNREKWQEGEKQDDNKGPHLIFARQKRVGWRKVREQTRVSRTPDEVRRKRERLKFVRK